MIKIECELTFTTEELLGNINLKQCLLEKLNNSNDDFFNLVEAIRDEDPPLAELLETDTDDCVSELDLFVTVNASECLVKTEEVCSGYVSFTVPYSFDNVGYRRSIIAVF